MQDRFLSRLLCGIALTLVLMLSGLAADKPVVENHADGTKKLTYALNPAGEKQGVQNEFYPAASAAPRPITTTASATARTSNSTNRARSNSAPTI